MDLETVDCPICEADDTVELLRARDLDVFGPGEFPVVRCRRCGLAYLSPRPTPQAMARYYPPHYWAQPLEPGAKSRFDAGTRRAFEGLVRDYPGGRVLDVGCGVGVKTAAMRDLGLDALGLEPYASPSGTAQERFGLPILPTTLQEADLPDGSLDAITFFEALEHVHDPAGDLRKAHALLRPGGAVYVRVPNFGAIQARLSGKWWYPLQAPRHLYHFTPGTLGRLLAKTGFARVESRAVPDWQLGADHFLFSTLYRLRGRLLGRKGLVVAPTAGQTVGEALEGKVYAGVPSAGKRAFRWLVRNVAYLPLAIENAIGRSVELLAIARR